MLPLKFTERMKSLLGDEYDEFEKALTEEKAKKGVRANTLKCTADELLRSGYLPISPLDYAENGFVLTDEVRGIGNTPEHASGQIYVQDPGAIAPLSAVEIPLQ